MLAAVTLGRAANDGPPYPSVTDMITDKGLLAISITNLGYFGTAFNPNRQPSGEYPKDSNVEHIYRGGIWVGARTPDGQLHVSTGAQDANGLEEGDSIREFRNDSNVDVKIISNSQNQTNYDPAALATQHIECVMDDYKFVESGNHTPLGLKVIMRALAWSQKSSDDFVILDYAIINISGVQLEDVYLGLWVDTTVGNTENTNPYDSQATNRWSYYDDKNGGWGAKGAVPPEYTVSDDPDIWMAYEHDADGDDGFATSWIGYRLLGTGEEPDPDDGVNPVSYNSWVFRGVPEKDDIYYDAADPERPLPGKYQIMSNGKFTVGMVDDVDYSTTSNWVGLLSTGPFRQFAPDDTLNVTFAIVAGPDSLSLLQNSKVAQFVYNEGLSLAEGPPSPILNVNYRDESVLLSWEPGTELDPDTREVLAFDSPLRSPEQHISTTTANKDFQGYRIYRFRGAEPEGDPFEIADLVAQYDIIDGIGFDTGLPPLDDQGRRFFTDTDLLDGFPYTYAVTSFSAPDYVFGLGELESGFNENGVTVYPGPAPSTSDEPRAIGVYPNPYRAGSLYDGRLGEQELNRRIWFTGLPARCRIQVFTLAGDLVQTLDHDDPASGQAYWDLLSGPGRAIASGLYIYVVRDNDTGEVQRGKLVIIK
jgi:hypothetical protein